MFHATSDHPLLCHLIDYIKYPAFHRGHQKVSPGVAFLWLKFLVTSVHKLPAMKYTLLLLFVSLTCSECVFGQDLKPNDPRKKAIYELIDKYSEAREKKDTLLLKDILTTDVDQLVSTGEWRDGIAASVKGMLNSSASSPGTRTLAIEKIRPLSLGAAVVDCKYEIQNPNGNARKMWSTFIVVSDKGKWKISAIRNMLPAGQ